MVTVLVGGITWYTAANNDAYVLPAESAVPLERVVNAFTAGKIAHLLLPDGTLSIDRRRLPLSPVPVDRVFPIGSAEVPWTPDPERWQIGLDIPVFSRNWQHLFRERSVFKPWGEVGDKGHFELIRRRLGPRPTFRGGLDRREMRFKYPQLVDPTICYRLGIDYAALPNAAEFAPVATVQEQLRLVAHATEHVIVFGPGQFGWVARAFTGPADAAIGRLDDSATPKTLDELTDFILRYSDLWRLEPLRRESNLILPTT